MEVSISCALQNSFSRETLSPIVSSKGISGANAFMLICTVVVDMSILVRSSSLVGVAMPPAASR